MSFHTHPNMQTTSKNSSWPLERKTLSTKRYSTPLNEVYGRPLARLSDEGEDTLLIDLLEYLHRNAKINRMAWIIEDLGLSQADYTNDELFKLEEEDLIADAADSDDGSWEFYFDTDQEPSDGDENNDNDAVLFDDSSDEDAFINCGNEDRSIPSERVAVHRPSKSVTEVELNRMREEDEDSRDDSMSDNAGFGGHAGGAVTAVDRMKEFQRAQLEWLDLANQLRMVRPDQPAFKSPTSTSTLGHTLPAMSTDTVLVSGDASYNKTDEEDRGLDANERGRKEDDGGMEEEDWEILGGKHGKGKRVR